MIQYHAANCVTFYRSRDPFGGLSNMASGYAIHLGRHRVRTSEHLYQVLRFPDHPELQAAILAIAGAVPAKRKAYESLALTRPDWDDVKVDIMWWCLQLKLLNNWVAFGHLLLATGERSIVEASPIDGFWGAKPLRNTPYLFGENMLGRLLEMLRRRLVIGWPIDLRIPVIDIPNFHFLADDAVALACVEPYQGHHETLISISH